jgi:hypothetical protein
MPDSVPPGGDDHADDVRVVVGVFGSRVKNTSSNNFFP